MAQAPKARDLRSVIAVFGPLGWRAIGGPAVHVALMEREIVRKRHWLERAEFGRLFAACNLMPGPGSTQLALLLGLRRAGVAGMLMAALLFIGPAVLIMLGLAEFYRHVGANHQVQLVLLGVDAAVVGIVARAALDLSLLSRRGVVGIAVACAALAVALVGVNPIAILAGGGVIAYAIWIVRNGIGNRHGTGHAGSVAPWIAAIHVPVVAPGLLPLGLTFLKIGAIAFGSGYVLLPLLHADFVGGTFHLTERQVADAFGLSQVTPGPVFAVAAFLGVQISGLPGGIVAALAIFAPSLVYVPLVSVVMRITESYPALRAALDGVVSAAVGLIAYACVTLARAAFIGPLEVAVALVVFAMLLRWPRAQPAGVLIGLFAGLLILATMH
ncbi:MAG: chromate efflux transporter [Candidatus Dormiibacterota bacterium]